MKKMIFIIAFWWLSAHAFSQALPEDITDFYQKYNFIEAYSTGDELSEIAFYIDQPDLPLEMQNERLSIIHDYYKEIYPHLYPKTQMPNDLEPYKKNLSLGLLAVEDYKIQANKVIIYCQSYDIDYQTQKQLIANFENNTKLPVSPDYQPMSKVTQTWILNNGKWSRLGLNKILCNMN